MKAHSRLLFKTTTSKQNYFRTVFFFFAVICENNNNLHVFCIYIRRFLHVFQRLHVSDYWNFDQIVSIYMTFMNYIELEFTWLYNTSYLALYIGFKIYM